MEFVATFTPRSHQTGGLENIDVLRDRLPGRTHAVLCREPGAQFVQGLSVSLLELVEDRPAGGIGECLEHVSHLLTIGKCVLACQWAGPGTAGRRPANAPARVAPGL